MKSPINAYFRVIISSFQREESSTLIDNIENDHKQQGQAFVEFVFLMATTFTLAYVFYKLSNRALSTRWTEMVNLIISPSKVTLP